MTQFTWLVSVSLSLYGNALFAAAPKLSEEVRQFVRVQAPTVILTHVRVIDGTGKSAVADQNVVIEEGRISRIETAADVTQVAGIAVIDLHGYSVMPGIVGIGFHATGGAHGRDAGSEIQPR